MQDLRTEEGVPEPLTRLTVGGPRSTFPSVSRSLATRHRRPVGQGEKGSDPVEPYLEAIATGLRPALRKRLTMYVRQGGRLESIGSAEELVGRMLDAVPRPSRWDDLLGPFYDTTEMARLLGGISRQAVAERRRRRTLLALKTSDGILVYPTFQLDEHNAVVAGLAEVLQSFGDEVDGWTLAGWLVSPSRALDGLSAVEWLRQKRDAAPVLALARDAARRFAE